MQVKQRQKQTDERKQRKGDEKRGRIVKAEDVMKEFDKQKQGGGEKGDKGRYKELANKSGNQERKERVKNGVKR